MKGKNEKWYWLMFIQSSMLGGFKKGELSHMTVELKKSLQRPLWLS